MEERPLGSTGRLVPVIGEGTWNMERDDRDSAIAAIRRGLDLGVTHIDTAEMYGNGAVEEIVGEAIARRRDQVYLVTKVLPGNASFDGTLRACERSLRRLRTDRIDLYLLHWPGPHPLEQTVRAFQKLREDDKIGAWGVSNFDVGLMQKALRIAGAGTIACNQVLYHLGERAIEFELIPWCERHGVSVVAYSPFGSGDFPSARSAGGRVLREIATDRRVGERQVALAFLARRPCVFTIPKAATVKHVEQNAAAGDLRLSDEEVARIDAAFPARPRSDLPTA